MACLYVAQSKGLQSWASDVGLTKLVFLVGVGEGEADALMASLNEKRHGGRDDWTLIGAQAADMTESTALERVARKETAINPTYYPQIKGARGIVKVKLANVENQLMVSRALEGRETKTLTIKAADIAAYLLRLAAG
jgi:hypothetical protein